MNIYVGNLSYETRDSDLHDAFAAFGSVDSARVVIDRETNRSKGFGFVEMGSSAEATQAIRSLDGKDLQSRTIKVNEAKPREARPARY